MTWGTLTPTAMKTSQGETNDLFGGPQIDGTTISAQKKYVWEAKNPSPVAVMSLDQRPTKSAKREHDNITFTEEEMLTT